MPRGIRILPARWPPHGGWPGVMRADMAAAFFDCPDTRALSSAVVRGEAPPPSALRGAGDRREPVWFRIDCEDFLARRRPAGDADEPPADQSGGLAALV